MAEDWRAQAACRGQTAMFYPPRGQTAEYMAAVAMCRTCPVREPCLEYALSSVEEFGVWGGTSHRERRNIRRARRQAQQEATQVA